jgi:hypothetical protein
MYKLTRTSILIKKNYITWQVFSELSSCIVTGSKGCNDHLI